MEIKCKQCHEENIFPSPQNSLYCDNCFETIVLPESIKAYQDKILIEDRDIEIKAAELLGCELPYTNSTYFRFAPISIVNLLIKEHESTWSSPHHISQASALAISRLRFTTSLDWARLLVDECCKTEDEDVGFWYTLCNSESDYLGKCKFGSWHLAPPKIIVQAAIEFLEIKLVNNEM